MNDVGREAGVTGRTVSNVMSGKANVRPATRDAVLRAVDHLGYQMNVSARGLRTGQTGFITLAIPDLAIDYFCELAQAVMTEADRYAWTVVIQQTGARRDVELAVLSGARRQLSDGLLFQPQVLGAGDEKRLSSDHPMVLLGERIFKAPVDHVTMANSAAACAATQYLIDRGRRQIAVIGPNPSDGAVSAAELRFDGHLRTLRANGIEFDERRMAVATEWHRSSGAGAMTRLLDSRVAIDAVFCFNDTLAFGALHALATRGVRVPDEVAVVGIDNVNGSAFSVPPLTTVDPGLRQIAKTAVDMLARRIGGDPGEPVGEVIADFELVVRRSA